MAVTDRRAAVLLDALADGPLSTSDLYDAVGYPALVETGMVPYKEFRDSLEQLEALGLVAGDLDEEEITIWRAVPRSGG